ncbi:MAG TPA: LytTR family DNA-binding domain-containing protein [Sphingorhabdus sp.]|nr:LytTR family DNA-binding domain-containing protein [Sphingorhabdus sp.]
MNQINVLVVDDEPLARRRMIRILKQFEWVGRVDEANNILSAKRLIEELTPGILLLDIEMPGGSGFELLNELGDSPPAIVFVTAFDHYALRAFEAQAIDYVTKPVEPGRFAMAMERARTSLMTQKQSEQISELRETLTNLKRSLNDNARGVQEFWVRMRNEYVRIPPEHILRFEADRDYVTICLPDTNYSYPESLASIERRIDVSQFWRVHRSVIVRRNAIARVKQAPFGALILVLLDGSEVRVGRTYLSKIRAALAR